MERVPGGGRDVDRTLDGLQALRHGDLLLQRGGEAAGGPAIEDDVTHMEQLKGLRCRLESDRASTEKLVASWGCREGQCSHSTHSLVGLADTLRRDVEALDHALEQLWRLAELER